jgi:acetyl esterase/lipase
MAEAREEPAMAPRPLDWLNGDVAALRAEYERQRMKPLPDNVEWATLGGIRVLRHWVEPSPKTAIVYFHGGGFIVGSPTTHADITVALGRETGLPLYSVDYRLAPEHPAPAPIEDGIAVIRHLLANGADRLILCGDSAGGAIALAVEASLATLIRKHVAGVCSFYGAYGLFDTPTLLEKGSRVDGTDVDCVRRYFELATGGKENPYGIKALARPSAVPVYLMAAEDDPLRDDSLHLAEALKARGRDVTLAVVEHENHGFLHGATTSPCASDAIKQVVRWIDGLSERH